MEGLLQEPIARPVPEDLAISLMAYDPEQEVITAWKPWTRIAGSSAT